MSFFPFQDCYHPERPISARPGLHGIKTLIGLITAYQPVYAIMGHSLWPLLHKQNVSYFCNTKNVINQFKSQHFTYEI